MREGGRRTKLQMVAMTTSNEAKLICNLFSFLYSFIFV